VVRYFLSELALVGLATAAMLIVCPNHGVAAMAAVVVTWVLFQLGCAYSFMGALYRGDIVEYPTTPRTYAVAPRGTVNWCARRFMVSYLRVAKFRETTFPTAAKPRS
jgi:hypothetical protein